MASFTVGLFAQILWRVASSGQIYNCSTFPHLFLLAVLAISHTLSDNFACTIRVANGR